MFAKRRRSRQRHSALWLLAGLAAGVVAGVVFADRIRFVGTAPGDEDPDAADEPDADDESEMVDEGDDEDHLDERVLSAFEQDPILSSRAIEIEEPEPGTIRLSGRVLADREIAHAVTIARGTPGVERVEQQLRLRGATRDASGPEDDE
jgi:hypothetical protein